MTLTTGYRAFRAPAFRVLWVAAVISNLGMWVHDVGATWLMTGLSPSPLMVSLVQAATTLPVFMIVVPAGVLADVFDRRHLLIVAQIWVTLVALTLGLLTLGHAVTPALLLVMTFVLGIGTALTAPAWQAIVPELVSAEDIPGAVTLNSAAINIGRAVGPAIGGIVVAAFGSASAFLLNAVSFAGLTGALLWWQRRVPASDLPREPLGSALRTGARYVRHNPALMAVLARTVAFILFAGALWALLPLVARERLGTGAIGYGTLLGAIGVGALTATVLLPWIRRVFTPDSLIVVGSLGYAAVLSVAALTRSYVMLLCSLVIGGMCWLVLLSTFQARAQLTVPSWVRGRALAFYLMIFFGGQAGGAIVWGILAEKVGTETAYLAAAGGMLLGLVVGRRFPLGSYERRDLSPSRHWPAHDVDPAKVRLPETERTILVTTEYRIDSSSEGAFRLAAARLADVRRRSGAHRWELYRDHADPGRIVEQFAVASWDEHLRQHERITVADQATQGLVRTFHVAPDPPIVRHLIGFA